MGLAAATFYSPLFQISSLAGESSHFGRVKRSGKHETQCYPYSKLKFPTQRLLKKLSYCRRLNFNKMLTENICYVTIFFVRWKRKNRQTTRFAGRVKITHIIEWTYATA